VPVGERGQGLHQNQEANADGGGEQAGRMYNVC
jgi:hypothetical protein